VGVDFRPVVCGEVPGGGGRMGGKSQGGGPLSEEGVLVPEEGPSGSVGLLRGMRMPLGVLTVLAGLAFIYVSRGLLLWWVAVGLVLLGAVPVSGVVRALRRGRHSHGHPVPREGSGMRSLGFSDEKPRE
jgi:hypothetical protein